MSKKYNKAILPLKWDLGEDDSIVADTGWWKYNIVEHRGGAILTYGRTGYEGSFLTPYGSVEFLNNEEKAEVGIDLAKNFAWEHWLEKISPLIK